MSLAWLGSIFSMSDVFFLALSKQRERLEGERKKKKEVTFNKGRFERRLESIGFKISVSRVDELIGG